MKPNALRSLIGTGHREQTVFTPPIIVEACRQLWGRIAYDPCHGSPGVVLTAAGRQVKAAGHLPAGPSTQLPVGLATRVQSCVNAERSTDSLGLIAPWPDRTFCNPPYNELHAWLEMSLLQSTDHILLIPVRCHRKWWRKWGRQAEIIALDPLKFLGHDQTFPAPLCLARRNSPAPGQLAEVCAALKLGEPW